MSATLHLVRMRIDAQKLYSFARRSRATARELDEGYAVHALLTALFDHGASEVDCVAPKPFHIVSSRERAIDVLGYSRADHLVLAERARTFADPRAWGVCDVEGLASKPMPSSVPSGKRLGFEVRVCPVRRIAKRGPMNKERAEVDAFVAKAWEVAPEQKLDRETVYREWLTEELEKEGAAKVVTAAMSNFHLDRVLRRTQGEERKAISVPRPDVRFEGVLEVGESEAFARRLARGVGRHRAFGFGMLLLRPAGAT